MLRSGIIKDFKEKLIYFLDRRKHDKKSNLKLVSVILAIIMIVGLFFPLVKLTGSINLKNTKKDQTILQIFNPKSSVFEVDSMDFLSYKDLDEYEILGTPINKFAIGDVNIYQLITSPMPDLKWLKKTNDTLNSGVLDFLVSKEFTDICDEYLGDFGKGVKDISKIIYDLGNNTNKVLDKVVYLSDQLNEASKSVQNAIASINNVIDIVDTVFVVLFLLPLIALILLIIGKGPRKLPAILLTIFTSIMVVLGLGIFIGGNIVDSTMLEAQTSVNEALRSLIYSLIPPAEGVLTATDILGNFMFELTVSVDLGLGWWLITIPSLVITVLAYIIASLTKKPRAKKSTKKEAN